VVLNYSQAKTFYDHFGDKQDAQSFYEDAALDELASHAAFDKAAKVFEFGCGTGRFALRLLTKQLPPTASYIGIDLSRTMIGIAQQRLAAHTPRATVTQSDGSMRFPLADQSVDRVLSTYVFDLLSETDIRAAITEARRVLIPGGKLCLVSLTAGSTLVSRIVSAVWSAVFNLHAPLVGGCRPIRLDTFLEQSEWQLEYHQVITQFGVPSEILIATPKQITGIQ
jgi:ubiquinone/menaquinone biosynthesis C-methylase UbiE